MGGTDFNIPYNTLVNMMYRFHIFYVLRVLLSNLFSNLSHSFNSGFSSIKRALYKKVLTNFVA